MSRRNLSFHDDSYFSQQLFDAAAKNRTRVSSTRKKVEEADPITSEVSELIELELAAISQSQQQLEDTEESLADYYVDIPGLFRDEDWGEPWEKIRERAEARLKRMHLIDDQEDLEEYKRFSLDEGEGDFDVEEQREEDLDVPDRFRNFVDQHFRNTATGRKRS